jgi:hypothetical protein
MVSRISQSTNRPTTVAEIRLEQQKTEKNRWGGRRASACPTNSFEPVENFCSGGLSPPDRPAACLLHNADWRSVRKKKLDDFRKNE